ncbi:MAG: cysteine desulfurase family protein [Candidatus Eiseniibacteriota bacterium]
MIYLDHAATTPVRPEVLEAMLPYFGEQFGNPSSVHRVGLAAGDAVAKARRTLGDLVGLPASSVVFTAGGTEADVLALRGVALGPGGRARSIVLSAIEHPAVLETGRALEADGVELRIVGVNPEGRVDPQEVANAVDASTAIVSIMHVNNETGAVQPIADLAALVKAKNPRTAVHVDAVQSFARYPVSFARWSGVDLVSIAGHKIYGPKGVGALFIRPGAHVKALITGGGQESGVRSGTHNVPGIVGLAEAARLSSATSAADLDRYAELARRFLAGLSLAVPDAAINGAADETPPYALRAPYILNVRFPGVPAEPLLHSLEAEDVLVSAGSACHSKDAKLSHVLAAMGVRDADGGCLRFSFGRATTNDHVDRALDVLGRAVPRLRAVARA